MARFAVVNLFLEFFLGKLISREEAGAEGVCCDIQLADAQVEVLEHWRVHIRS